MTVPDARRAVLLALRRRGEAAFAGAALSRSSWCGARVPRRRDGGATTRIVRCGGVEDLLGDLGLHCGGRAGVVRVEVEALTRIERRATADAGLTATRVARAPRGVAGAAGHARGAQIALLSI